MKSKVHIKSLIAIVLAGAYVVPQAVFSADLVCTGCVNSSDIASKAVTTDKLADSAVKTGKIADGAVTSAKIAAGTVLKSLNGLRDDVTLSAGAGISIATNGNSITISSGASSAAGNAGGSNGIVSVDSSNYATAAVKDGDYVKITGQISLTKNLELFRNKANLHINGGTIQGTGKETVYLMRGATVENVTFSNVKISTEPDDTYPTKFVNCTFSQLSAFSGNSAVISGSRIVNTTTRLGFSGTIDGSRIYNESANTTGEVIVDNLTNSEVQSIKLYFSSATNNYFTGASLSTNATVSYFDRNICEGCDFVSLTANGTVSITNNTFISPGFPNKDYILKIQEDPYNNTKFSTLRVENNVFTNQSMSDKYYVDIAIDGAFTSPLTMLNISNNTFLNPSQYKAAQAISDASSGDLKKVIQHNVTSNINLGVAEDGASVSNNLAF